MLRSPDSVIPMGNVDCGPKVPSPDNSEISAKIPGLTSGKQTFPLDFSAAERAATLERISALEDRIRSGASQAAEVVFALDRISSLEDRVRSLEASNCSMLDDAPTMQEAPSDRSFTLFVEEFHDEKEDKREEPAVERVEPLFEEQTDAEIQDRRGEPAAISVKPVANAKRAADSTQTVVTVETVEAVETIVRRSKGGSRRRSTRRSMTNDTAASGMSEHECEEISDKFECEHVMQETVWESALLAFSPGVGTWHSVGIVLVLVFNVWLQLAFCMVVALGLAQEDTFPSLLAAEKWRESVAHSDAMMDQSSWVSLAAQVCNRDRALPFSTSQVSTLVAIDDYVSADILPWTSTGPMLCVLCLIIWLLSVVQEFRSSFSFFLAVVNLPRGDTIIAKADDELQYVSVSQSRFIATTSMCVLRHSIAFILSWAGAQWLAYTVSTSEMLLNAAALTFILDLDEILFRTMLPSGVQALVSRVQPLQRPWVKVKGVDLWPALTVVWVLGFVMFHLRTSISVREDELKAMNETLCGGDLNFVLHHNLETNLLHYTTTNNYTDPAVTDTNNTFVRRAARQLVDKDMGSIGILALMQPPSDFTEATRDTMEDIPNFRCADLLVGIPSPFFFAALDKVEAPEGGAASFEAVNKSNATCEDYREACWHPENRMLRLLCPVTCGCADPFSGQSFNRPRAGCPANCRARSVVPSYTDSLASVACEDRSGESLRSSEAWQRYWSSYLTYFRQRPALEMRAQGFATQALDIGCAALVANPFVYTHDVCRDGDTFASLRPFCPISCGCAGGSEQGSSCPTQCAFNQSIAA